MDVDLNILDVPLDSVAADEVGAHSYPLRRRARLVSFQTAGAGAEAAGTTGVDADGDGTGGEVTAASDAAALAWQLQAEATARHTKRVKMEMEATKYAQQPREGEDNAVDAGPGTQKVSIKVPAASLVREFAWGDQACAIMRMGKSQPRQEHRILHVDHEEVRVGYMVELKAPSKGAPPWVACIDRMWQQGQTMLFRVQWFYRPADIAGRVPAHAPNELFLSSCFDDNQVHSYIAKCFVDFMSDDPAPNVGGYSRYVCRQRYTPSTHRFSPLSQAEQHRLQSNQVGFMTNCLEVDLVDSSVSSAHSSDSDDDNKSGPSRSTSPAGDARGPLLRRSTRATRSTGTTGITSDIDDDDSGSDTRSRGDSGDERNSDDNSFRSHSDGSIDYDAEQDFHAHVKAKAKPGVQEAAHMAPPPVAPAMPVDPAEKFVRVRRITKRPRAGVPPQLLLPPRRSPPEYITDLPKVREGRVVKHQSVAVWVAPDPTILSDDAVCQYLKSAAALDPCGEVVPGARVGALHPERRQILPGTVMCLSVDAPSVATIIFDIGTVVRMPVDAQHIVMLPTQPRVSVDAALMVLLAAKYNPKQALTKLKTAHSLAHVGLTDRERYLFMLGLNREGMNFSRIQHAYLPARSTKELVAHYNEFKVVGQQASRFNGSLDQFEAGRGPAFCSQCHCPRQAVLVCMANCGCALCPGCFHREPVFTGRPCSAWKDCCKLGFWLCATCCPATSEIPQPDPADGDQSPVVELDANVSVEREFLVQAQTSLGATHPHVLAQLVDVLLDFGADRINIGELAKRMFELLADHHDLLWAFNQFLPAQFRNEKHPDHGAVPAEGRE